VPEQEAESYAARIRKIMLDALPWTAGLPLDVEINYGPTLGDCK
jgi:hypothetical protein